MNKRCIGWMLCFTVAAVCMKYVFQMHWFAAGIVWLTGMVCCSIYERAWRRCKEAKVEFYDLTVYMEQLICSYKRLGNIVLALEDCALLFPENASMGKAIATALHVLRTGDGIEEGDVISHAFYEMEKRYPSRRLYMMHDFISCAERMGGDTAESLDILMGDLQLWKRRTAVYQKKKEFVRRESMLAIVLSIFLCGITQVLIPKEFGINLAGQILYQCSTAVVFCGIFLVEAFIFTRLTGSWLDRERKDEKRGIRQNIEREFPFWLLSVSLYLQQDSVYQAIKSSLRHVHGIFANEVSLLLEKMYEKPGMLEPFLDFFREQDLSEVQTGMKILYSVNANGYQDTRKQIRFLVEENNLVMDRYEQSRFEQQMAGMGMLKQIPMVMACGKLFTDLGILIMLVMNTFQTIL